VQAAIERHFRELGFNVDANGHVDLTCEHPQTGERWHIEAKGKTSACGLDFRTCLGQLVQGIRDREARYGVALPEIPQYAAQIDRVSDWVIEALHIHWLLVSPEGIVSVKRPPNRTPHGA